MAYPAFRLTADYFPECGTAAGSSHLFCHESRESVLTYWCAVQVGFALASFLIIVDVDVNDGRDRLRRAGKAALERHTQSDISPCSLRRVSPE